MLAHIFSHDQNFRAFSIDILSIAYDSTIHPEYTSEPQTPTDKTKPPGRIHS